MNRVHVCSFQSGPTVTRRTSYADLKRAVLDAGRFSAFEATANDRAAGMFNTLCHDPEVETFDLGYPWKGVRRRASAGAG